MATQAEIAVLRGTATQVKNESQVGSNTAGRVGGLFEGIVDALPSDEVIDGKISEAVADIQPIVIEGNVDNAPDQEDLTSVNQGGTDVLKFKDKTYSPALFSGLGRVYLRKNVVTPENLGYAVNLLTAEMVAQPNTIYLIQYDYDLNGETITLPTGCVLEFDGGSIKNGTLTFNGTTLKGLQDESITGCRFNGTITNEEINVRHLGVSSALADAAAVINDIVGLLTSNERKKMYFPADTYTTYSPIVPCDNLEIYGDGEASKIQNLATTGTAKHVIRCDSFPALSTGAARSNSYTKYSVTSISEDRMSIEVSGDFSLAVGDLSAVFGGLAGTSDGPYYYYTYVGIVVAINDNIITFDKPLPVNNRYSDYIFAPNAMGTYTTGFWRKNVYVHDLFLYQQTGTTSGYYCITGGYNCRYERLKMHTSTPMGSNLAAHCVFKDIVADCEAGFWDSAELQFDNLYENIVITRFASRLNVIGFNITNGSYNTVRKLRLVGSKALVGGYFTCHLNIDGLTIQNCTFNTTTSSQGMLICAYDATFKNVYYDGCSIAQGTGNILYVVNSTGGIAENIRGIFEVAEGITASNRFKCERIINIDVSSNFHTGSVMGDAVNKYRLYSRLQSTQIAFGQRLINADLADFIKNGVFIHARFDIVYPDSSKAIAGSNVRMYMSNTQEYINFTYRFANYNYVEAEMFITANNDKADYVLILRNPECHEIVSGTKQYPTKTGDVLSLMMRTNTNAADTYYNNYCYTEIYY